ncbi:emopamil-binding (phenylalkylamine Ca2+ antagonist binding) [Fusarium albosuccineum]|uniref:Emopamil-binding (Phenylalkylamine Ca2+ antagonist binding) n=1 Tax=Fusarium albosuccineum TaxID=1237068 RepID=A0A8H4KNN5_9HYPO|nr:emopamil-binding (phenylalkylamine Ca2+ antagonist binding) [Fusarium albosuccineum]
MVDPVVSDSATDSTAPGPAHPYFPADAIIPGYVANDKPVTELLVTFGAITGAVIGFALWQTTGSKRSLPSIDRFAAAWFALCGFLHVAFEGYYLAYRHQLPGMSSLFAQLWKEYALSDSRYLTHDIFTISVETITFLAWGPLSLLTVAGIVKGTPSRHVVQVIVCTAHLYGVALYYLTNWNESRMHGVAYSRPETLYFWIYYVGFNLPWAVVPFGESSPSDTLREWSLSVSRMPPSEAVLKGWQQIGKAFVALEEKTAKKEE